MVNTLAQDRVLLVRTMSSVGFVHYFTLLCIQRSQRGILIHVSPESVKGRMYRSIDFLSEQSSTPHMPAYNKQYLIMCVVGVTAQINKTMWF